MSIHPSASFRVATVVVATFGLLYCCWPASLEAEDSAKPDAEAGIGQSDSEGNHRYTPIVIADLGIQGFRN